MNSFRKIFSRSSSPWIWFDLKEIFARKNEMKIAREGEETRSRMGRKNTQNWNDRESCVENWNYESRFIAWNINKNQAWNFSRDKRTKEEGMREREKEREKWELLKYLSTHRGWWYPRSNTRWNTRGLEFQLKLKNHSGRVSILVNNHSFI